MLPKLPYSTAFVFPDALEHVDTKSRMRGRRLRPIYLDSRRRIWLGIYPPLRRLSSSSSCFSASDIGVLGPAGAAGGVAPPTLTG